MKTKHYLILAAALLLLCFVYINTVGDHISSDFMIYGEERDPKAYSFKIENEEVLALTGMSVGDGFVRGEFESLAPGNTIVYLSDGSNIMNGQMFYVHRSGLITEDTIYGRCTGGEVFPAAAAVILALLLYDSVKRLKKSMAEDLYRYANIRDMGLVIYLSAFLLLELVSVFNFKGLLNAACLITDTAQTILFFSFPLVFLTSVMVSLSNLKLMRNEGKSLKNMLGFILGLLFCVGILFPEIMNAFLQRTTLVDVHNQRGIALYIFLFIENIIYVMVAYLECMLIGTIVIAVKAARAVPPFDRDCIMILGCRVAKDGSLTRLLKGRADRALEFARMQKERSGKDIIFIPSGGKGADEPVSEAEAVKNYLLSCGVPEDHIITEDKSAD
ncbi:MAG: YdcF family protein, partial [Firmicutes bacterium]|nr:YdcF family protein [Bacillota bacterium]